MENLITITEAASRAGVSDKTLRRAIEKGQLVAQPRMYQNQPVMIAVSDLETWVASRQPAQTSTVEARIVELEQTVQRLQEQSEIDHKLAYSRLDALEERIRILEIETQTPEQINQEIDQWMVAKPELQHLIERERAKLKQETSVPADETTFELADFSQLLQPIYRSSATRGDVKAWLNLRPEPQGVEGDYSIVYLTCGRADGKRASLTGGQQSRGEQLKSDLRYKVVQSLLNAGWQAGPHGIYVCPKGK